MIGLTALLLAATAYGMLYAAHPGRQARTPVSAPRTLQVGAGGLTLVALVLAAHAYGADVGLALVLTVLMTVASVLVVAVPFIATARRKPKTDR